MTWYVGFALTIYIVIGIHIGYQVYESTFDEDKALMYGAAWPAVGVLKIIRKFK